MTPVVDQSLQTDGPPSILVTRRVCTDIRHGGGQRTHLLLEALRRIGPVIVALDGSNVGPGDRENLPGAAAVVALGGATTRLPGFGRFLRWRRRHAVACHYQDYALRPQAARALRALVREHGAKRVVYRYLTSFTQTVRVDDAEIEAISIVDLDDRDDRLAETSWRRLLGRFGALLNAAVMRPLILGRMRTRLARLPAYLIVAEDDALADCGRAIHAPNAALAPKASALTTPSEQSDILFVGSYPHFPNPRGVAWFLHECWPHIRAAHPDATFRVVGFGPWNRMAEMFPGIEGVDFRGFVPDVSAEYATARVAVAPLLDGGGTKIKILEAAAYGRPIVATNEALRGIDPRLKAEIAGSDAPEALAAACIAFLENDAAADEAGRRVREVHDSIYARVATVAALADALTVLNAAPRRTAAA